VSHSPARARYFSLDEADRTIPLVRRIVRDIRDEYRDLQQPLRRLREFEQQEAPGEVDQLRRDIDRRSRRLNGFLDELIALGCHFKDFDLGLVDFFSRLDGRPVHLCWKLGEPRIAWWHEIDAGFAGRRPIAPEQRELFQP